MFHAQSEYKPGSFTKAHGMRFITKNIKLVCQMAANEIPVVVQYAVIFCIHATAKSASSPLAVREDYEYTGAVVMTLVYIFDKGRIVYLKTEDLIYRLVVYSDGSLDSTVSVYR